MHPCMRTRFQLNVLFGELVLSLANRSKGSVCMCVHASPPFLLIGFFFIFHHMPSWENFLIFYYGNGTVLLLYLV